jgi:predicted HTH domain antitoxin
MVIHVPDDILRQAGLNEHDALVEFACRLFDAERLDLFGGARLAGLSRTEFEAELRARRIPIYRPTLQDVEDDEAASCSYTRQRRDGIIGMPESEVGLESDSGSHLRGRRFPPLGRGSRGV